MHVLLTGGTGFIGAAVLRHLVDAGHHVTAVVRSSVAADLVTVAGAQPVLGDLTDTAWLEQRLAAMDAAIHLATPGDETSSTFDESAARAAAAAFGGTGKRYLHTGGIWVWGSGPAITESSPFDPPALTAWRRPVESLVLDDDVNAVVVAPAIVHGHDQGIPHLVTKRYEDGAVHLVGDGSQHWTTVHVEDLADLYLRALEGDITGYLIGASGHNPTVRELVEAGAEAADGDVEVRVETVDETRARLTPAFADALLLDQQASGERARTALGWAPTHPTLVDELRGGRYQPPVHASA